MRFSITNMMTIVSILAWGLALYSTSLEYRGAFVVVSLLVLVCLMFGIAMGSPKDENGTINPERNFVFQALEPTFRTVGIVCAGAIIFVLLGLIVCVIWLGVAFAMQP